MLNKKHALAFIWVGNPPTDQQVHTMGNYLLRCGLTNEALLTTQYKDEEGIASSIIGSAAKAKMEMGVGSWNSEDIHEAVSEEAITSAIEYIGKRFEGPLADTKDLGNLMTFALILQKEASKAYAKNERLRNYDETCLVNALEILSTATGTIPLPLAKKHHLTRGVISVIKQIYNQLN